MSQSDEETPSQKKQSTQTNVRFADEVGPSTAPSAPATPSTPSTETTTVKTPSSDDPYTDAFIFARSKTFSSTLIASLTSTDAILKEVRDCVITNNDESCRQVSP